MATRQISLRSASPVWAIPFRRQHVTSTEESKNHAMQSTPVLIKTAKGLDEIDKRTYQLVSRLRVLLFMIDGQRTLGELLNQARNMAETLETQLAELAAQDFIELRAAENAASLERPLAEPSTPRPSEPANSAPLSVLRLAPIGALKARLTNLLAESLGVRAMFVTAQIERLNLHRELALVKDEIARSMALSSGIKVAEHGRQRARTLVEIPA